MSRVLVIGCGGVASVAIQKCCQVSDVFTELCIASRTKSKCDALAEKLAGKTKTIVTTAQVDADDVQQVIDLIRAYKPDLVMNIALLWMLAWLAASTIWTRQTMSRRTPMIRNGVQFMKSAVKKKDFRHTLITLGSGHIERNLRMPA